MANPQIKVRLKPGTRKKYEALKIKFGLVGKFGADTTTVTKLIELSEKHIRLSEKIKDMFGGLI